MGNPGPKRLQHMALSVFIAALCAVAVAPIGSRAAAQQQAYDPRTDPDHPLKNVDVDPGEGWENHRRADGTPNVATTRANWPWGDLYYDDNYPSKLIISNTCKARQPVHLFVNNLPYISLPSAVTVPGEGQLEVEIKIDTPPEPAPPIMAGPNPPGWGWVKPPPMIRAAVDAPTFHQPNFVNIQGNVVAWHPWIGDCLPARDVYAVSGHIHFRPPEPEDPSSKDEPALCEAYWKLGRPPADLEDEDCTERIRQLATHYRERVLAPYELRAPKRWDWLPSSEEIQQMSIDDLLVMKARAERLMSGQAVHGAIHEIPRREGHEPGEAP